MTWIKQTPDAIYLMEGGEYLDLIPLKAGTATTIKVAMIQAWFDRPDAPGNWVVDLTPGQSPPKVFGRRINDAGLALVKEFEGLKLKAYPDPGTGGKPWTIGYGHTSAAGPPDVEPGDTITEIEAETILRNDLAVFERHVLAATSGVSLTENQFSALVSLVFNVGPGAFESSTLLRLLKQGNIVGAANEFPGWNMAAGKVLTGLTRRRQKEQELFLKN
jgi:GH24 family phage-related lysozyme (muramidase)